MSTKPYPSEMQERFIVRLPDGMRDQIADAAKQLRRSMNTEVVARLAASFHTSDPNEDPLAHVRPDIEQFAAKHGMSFRSAIETLVTSALAPDAPAVVYISIQPGTSVAEVQQQLRALRPGVPADAAVITDRPLPK